VKKREKIHGSQLRLSLSENNVINNTLNAHAEILSESLPLACDI